MGGEGQDREGTSVTIIVRNDHFELELTVELIHNKLSASVLQAIMPQKGVDREKGGWRNGGGCTIT